MNYGEIAHIGHGITLALLSIINGCDIEGPFIVSIRFQIIIV